MECTNLYILVIFIGIVFYLVFYAKIIFVKFQNYLKKEVIFLLLSIFVISIYYQKNIFLNTLILTLIPGYLLLANKKIFNISFSIMSLTVSRIKMFKTMVIFFSFIFFLVPFSVSAKDDGWIRLKCKESWWFKTKVTCDIYSTKTANYPKLKRYSAYLDYSGIKFTKFSSYRSELKYKNNEIYMIPLKEKVKKGEKLGVLNFDVINKNKYYIYIDEFYYQFEGNNKYNSNWMFLGDSFFDMLDGVNINSNSNTIVSNGYYNHTDNKYSITNGKKNPSLGKISSLGISGATTFLISSYFNGLNITYLPNFPKLNKLPQNINKIAIYLGTNDARNYLNGDINYSPDAVSSYMRNIVEKLNNKYNNPEIYILRIFGRPRQLDEEVILKQYNQKYQLLAQKYDNVSFVNTEYLSNYQLADKTGLLRDPYYAFYTKKDYGYAGHLTVSAYDEWTEHLITSLSMNYGQLGDKKNKYSG